MTRQLPAMLAVCLWLPTQITNASGQTMQTPPAGNIKLTLMEAEDLALKKNPQVGQAEYQAKAYGEITKEFQAAYYPTLEGNVTAVGADSGSRLSAGALNNPIVFSRVGTGVTANALLTDFGRTETLVRSASLSAQAQQQAVNLTKADIVLRTDAAYLAVLRSRALRDVAQETVKTRQDAVDQVDALFRSKLKSSLDLSFAQVNLADAKLLLTNGENDLRSSESQLARLLALPADSVFDLAQPGADTPLPTDAAVITEQALQRRPDLLQRRLDLKSTQTFARAEQLLSRPTVGFSASAGYVPAGNAAIPGTYGAAGVNMRIPVFNGGLFRARRFEAESRAAAAQKGVENLELQIRSDVRIAWLDAKNAFDKLDLTQQLLNQARQALDLAQARYKLGLSSIAEFSQSQLQYTAAELALARSKYDYTAQRSILSYQVGQVR